MTSTLTSTEQPLLGRCKDCDFALFVGSDKEAKQVEGFKEVRQNGVAYKVGVSGYFARCDKGHKVFVLKRIKGKYSADHKCDARCLNAKGHECTCSCGGANHGRGYAVVHEAHEEVEPILIGEINKHIVGTARVTLRKDVNDATLYVLQATSVPATIKWFAPSYANPEWEVGKVVKFRAKVKRHEDNEYGKATIVTYLEEKEN